MRPRAGLASFVVLAAALAGCMGSDDMAPTARDEPLDSALVPSVSVDAVTGATANASAEAPVWNVGDAWAISTSGTGESERAFLVVAAAGSDAYTLATTSERMAGFDAMFDVSYVGKIRASDLAGHQQGEPVKYFDFPLADGKTWTAKWDGFDVALTATKKGDGFAIVGAVDGAAYVEYDYAPDMKWLTHIHFLQGDYGFKVERLQSNWTGVLATATAKVIYESAPLAPIGSPGAGSFTVDEGQTFAMVTLAGGGSQWARAFTLVDPAGQPYSTSTIGNAETEAMGPRGVYLQEQLPATPGEWRIAAPSVHDPTGAFFVTIHEVAVASAPFGA